MKYIRIYSDLEGETHIEDVKMETSVRELTTNVPPLTITQSFGATEVFFIRTEVTDTFQELEFHNPPRKMLVIQLKGSSEQEASDGTKRVLNTGDVMVVEDVHGKGHRSKNFGDEVLYALIPLSE